MGCVALQLLQWQPLDAGDVHDICSKEQTL